MTCSLTTPYLEYRGEALLHVVVGAGVDEHGEGALPLSGGDHIPLFPRHLRRHLVAGRYPTAQLRRVGIQEQTGEGKCAISEFPSENSGLGETFKIYILLGSRSLQLTSIYIFLVSN